MATRRRPSATKSAKAATFVKKSPSVVTNVTKYTQPIEINKVTETPTAARVRPEQPNLTLADYTADIKVRWEIHVWETQELWADMKKGYQFAQPFVMKTIDYLKDSYDRAFNETEEQKAN